MEEKLLQLIQTSKQFTEESEEYYTDIEIDFTTLEISIRRKNSFEYVETREIYLDKVDLKKFDELISFIEKYEVQQ